MRLGRAYARSAIAIGILALALFVVLVAVVLPPRTGAIDVARAKRIVAAQWYVPVLAIHLMFVLPGAIAPWLRADRSSPAAWAGFARLPLIWVYVLIAQLMIALGLFAGIVPGVLALAPAALVAAAVAHGARGTEALRVAAARAASQRGRLIAVVVIAIAAELALTYAASKALVPRLDKKTPPAALANVVLFAWVNAVRVAITTPLIATLLAALYDDSATPQAASAARTPAASTAATTA